MTQAPLVSVEVVVAGMGGILVVSTPETVMGELAEPLESRHIKHRRRYVFGEPCMRGRRAVCGIKDEGQDVSSPVSVSLLSCVCCSALCPSQIFAISSAKSFSGIPLFGGPSSCIASRIGVL